VAEDAAQPLDLATAALDPDWAPVTQRQEVGHSGLRALPAQIAEELASQLAAHWHPSELRPLPPTDLKERRLAVVLDVLDDQRAQLAHAHARAEEDEE